MSRQFGLSSRPALGAGNTQGGSLPRVAVSRELDEHQKRLQAHAEKWLSNPDVKAALHRRPEPIQLAGATSRPANSRGVSPELSIREYAAAFFFAAFLSGIAVCLWFLSIVIDWSGVLETLHQG